MPLVLSPLHKKLAGNVLFACRCVLPAGSSTQVGVLVVPFCVVLAWMMGQPLDLNFNEFEALVLFISVLLAASVVQVRHTGWPVPGTLPCLCWGCVGVLGLQWFDTFLVLGTPMQLAGLYSLKSQLCPCAALPLPPSPPDAGWDQQLAQRRHAGADVYVHFSWFLGAQRPSVEG